MLKKALLLLLACNCFVAIALAQNHPHTVLWKIEGKGLTHPSYLFGTHHTYDGKDFTSAHPVVLEALNRTTSEVSEVAPGAPTLDFSQIYFGGDTTLHQFLSNAEYDTITNFIHEKMPGDDAPIQRMLKMKPQVLLAAFSELLVDTSAPANPGMDLFLSQYATDKGYTLQGLEGASERTALLMSSINYRKPLQEILSIIRDIKQGKPNTLAAADKEYHDLTMDYALDKPVGQDFGGAVARNEIWLKRLPGMMQQQSCFIAVGYHHLKTKAGLIVGLRKLGYKVTPVVI